MSIAAGPSVDDLVHHQMAPWRDRAFTGSEIERRIRDLSDGRTTVVEFRLDQDGVAPREKYCVISDVFPHEAYLQRVDAFRKLLEDARVRHRSDRPLVVAIDIGDGAADNAETPVLSFQKVRHDHTILIPDVELILSDYLADSPSDGIAFADKSLGATFSGSTTGGGFIDDGDVAKGSFPRLRAARYFRRNRYVEFNLSQIVQCSATAELLLREEGYGSGYVPWTKAYGVKFGISIDGNGAACSRPAILLKSNCALLKYDSDNVLFYTHALVDGIHFIKINEDGDIDEVIEEERWEPGKFQDVASRGTEFVGKFLSRPACLDYTAALLREYEQVFYR